MQANVNPDRTASKGAVRSGFILLVRTVVYRLPLSTCPGMQTNVSPDRTASKGAVRSGLILLVRTDVYYLPLLHRSGYANKCEP